MKLPIEYIIQVSQKRQKAQILLKGEWLEHLGFEINSFVRLEYKPHQILLTSCQQDEDRELMLMGTSITDDPENALIESKRYEAMCWLENNSALREYLEEIKNSFVLTAQALDLIVLLKDKKLIVDEFVNNSDN